MSQTLLLKRKAVDKPEAQILSKPVKRRKVSKDAPATSAQPPPPKHPRQHLTLADWITVYAYVDKHPTASQGDIVKHFGTLPTGALIFNQSTLSRKLRQRSGMEARVSSHPNALSGKRPRAVVRPDVERALILWIRHMENKGETVTGLMVKEKRRRFEDEFQVPETERLSGNSWIQRFCAAYKIREHRRHGEAGSVNLEAVEAECMRCQQLLARYAPCDWYNVDETSFFP
jgi:hypothetical protein